MQITIIETINPSITFYFLSTILKKKFPFQTISIKKLKMKRHKYKKQAISKKKKPELTKNSSV